MATRQPQSRFHPGGSTEGQVMQEQNRFTMRWTVSSMMATAAALNTCCEPGAAVVQRDVSHLHGRVCVAAATSFIGAVAALRGDFSGARTSSPARSCSTRGSESQRDASAGSGPL
jgi:hypothetical protein